MINDKRRRPVSFPWLKHSRLTMGRKCTRQADIFYGLRVLRYDRRASRQAARKW